MRYSCLTFHDFGFSASIFPLICFIKEDTNINWSRGFKTMSQSEKPND